jgi:hypothetical protein
MGNRLAIAGSNEDLQQDCVTSCLAVGGTGERDCVAACRGMFGGRGGKVLSVHPSEFFTPSQIRPATVLRPYQS